MEIDCIYYAELFFDLFYEIKVEIELKDKEEREIQKLQQTLLGMNRILIRFNNYMGKGTGKLIIFLLDYKL